MTEPKVRRAKIADLIPDHRNANLGTERGLKLLDDSLRDNGLGRGIVVDRDMEIIGGNKTVERAADIGFTDVIIVPTDGRTLVVTQRTDLDLDSEDPRARRLAIADNRVSEIDLDWSPDILASLAKEDPAIVAGFWTADEWSETVLSAIENTEPEDEKEDGETLVDQAVQLKPQREYCMIFTETPEQWEQLKEILNLVPVRRGGYKAGSPFDHIGYQRVVPFPEFVDLISAWVDKQRESLSDD